MQHKQLPRPLRVLVVEDDDISARLTKRALDMWDAPKEIQIVKSGDGVPMYYAETGEVPDLILLDWNLPGLHGREVLAWIRAEGRPTDVPIVIVTSSSYDGDREESSRLGANAYVVKGFDFNSFKEGLLGACQEMFAHAA